MKLLIVEDEPNLLAILEKGLCLNWMETENDLYIFWCVVCDITWCEEIM
jgi:hypothetical protein